MSADNIQTGHSIRDTAAECGLDFEPVKRGSVAAGISAVRQLLPQLWMAEQACAEGLDALERYRYEWNPDVQAFSQKPEPSKYSHAADALRTFAVGYQEEPDDTWTPAALGGRLVQSPYCRQGAGRAAHGRVPAVTTAGSE